MTSQMEKQEDKKVRVYRSLNEVKEEYFPHTRLDVLEKRNEESAHEEFARMLNKKTCQKKSE